MGMLEKLTSIEKRHAELEAMLSDPVVSRDYSKAHSLIKEHTHLKTLAVLSREYREVIRALREAEEIAHDESDKDMAALARNELSNLKDQQAQIEHKLRIALLPQDPNDEKNVIMEIRAGTGGEEAGLFAGNLFRMYSRYSQQKGWRVDIISSNETGLGSIKAIVFQINGKGAYSHLKHESGGHRVQRIPITESSGRVHTSAATVAVLPEAEEVDVDIKSEDLQIDIFHSSGHGGQNVQKVATAIRITHLPTNLVAICQDERSQLKNKEKAMSVLRSRVLAKEIQRQQDELSETRRSQVGTGDRSDKVRTYNFPQDRVTDHRTSLTVHNLERILDGNLDQFTEAMSKLEQAHKIDATGL